MKQEACERNMFYQNVSEFFLLNVRRYPNKTAVIFGDERYTYDQLNRKINRIANGMKRLGIQAGDRVAFLFGNCTEIVTIYYAIQKIGAVAVPLNFRLVSREIGFLINASDSTALIYSSEFADKVGEARAAMSTVKFLIPSHSIAGALFSLSELMALGSEEEPALFRDENAVSRIQYTGGSTGIPKGVMRTHGQDLTEIAGELMYNKLGYSQDEVVLIQCPLEHHGGHSWFTAALSSGGSLVICAKFDPKRILEYIQAEKVSYILMLPPTTFLRFCESPEIPNYDLSSVRVVNSAAGGTSKDIILRTADVFPNAEIFYGWGQTESGLGTSHILTREMVERDDPRLHSIGRAMPFVEMKIVDDSGNEVPRGTPGEALIRSPAGMKGYYGQDAITAQMFEKDGWLHTGDIMYEDGDGFFYMLSRKKDVIKSGGENVFAHEVENVVKEHPSVAECVVVGVPDEALGEAIMAVVQLRPGHTLTLAELQAHCKARISSYKKPLFLEFVDKFDMDDAGKIRRSEILKTYNINH
jgi:acyl-CoA synthetase (AMP-forming)/AMP-acid ligase II